jgi:hypothetical protein
MVIKYSKYIVEKKMGCGCNKKASVTNKNNTNEVKKQPVKMPLVTTNTSSDAKKAALANISKKISKRQE